MKRNSINFLETWLDSSNRKPLIIRGARQVGKSTLVRLFCEVKNIELIEVNLEYDRLICFEENQTPQIEDVLSEIEVRTNKKITKRSLLFIDEIQARPNALKFLRYFFEKRKDLAVIAAGSLIEFALEDKNFSMPVGRVEYLHLGPMTYSEFLMALNQNILLENLQKNSINSGVHDQAQKYLHLYYFIGGMPEAVKTYAETKSLLEVRKVQRSLIQSYQDDFSKYSNRRNLKRLTGIFQTLPNNLGKKVKYSELDRDLKSTEVKNILDLFLKAKIITQCLHTDCSGIPIRSCANQSLYKLFFIDVGLMNYLHRIEWPTLNINSEQLLITKGIIAEQFIAQHLAYINDGTEPPELFYWFRDKTNSKAEVDFITEYKGNIYPIEVKAGASGKLKSINIFLTEKKLNQAIRFNLTKLSIEKINTKLKLKDKNVTFEYTLTSLPIYMIEFLKNYF